MALRKYTPSSGAPQTSIKPLTFVMKSQEKPQIVDTDRRQNVNCDVDIDIREVYFLIMHFLSTGPCHRTYGHLWNELLEHELLPRRYHAWYSRTGLSSGDENDDGLSLPLSYNKLVERYPHVEKGHLVSLLKQLLITSSPSRTISYNAALGAADVPSLLGTGVFSLLEKDRFKGNYNTHRPPIYMRWPHMKADQLRGLCLREIGGGFPRHHRAPSIRAACYTIAKPSTMVQKMQNIKRLRGHRNAVYCAIFDHSGRYVITGSDDRLVKIWSMDIAYCIASCRGHEGDITDLAVSPNNALVASSSNDCIIRVWRLPDGMPVSVLKGHTGVVTAITFSPRSPYNLLSSSDDGTCRIWDGRNSQIPPRIYSPRVSDTALGRENAPPLIAQSHQIFCCAFNANGTVFVTGSSDNSARVWSALKSNVNEPDHQVNHELDVLSGHENDVNYVQFSGCAVASRFTLTESIKEDNIPKFKNSWFTHDNIVTCSKDGSAIIWIPRSRRSHGKVGRWTRAYHLKVPPPLISPQPQRGGPRQRAPLTPRGVNMIVWSLDNRFVLAAIMDCRICVWNAADGSLVHSLTGHSQSTYVLDVHPFNPRIAMSAGYDGKTIIWDIWEGTPIKVYEISRFKLVDGKFSPDGTSIILSDDVGQLYILSTGQGESQNDAQYDQFFLGDYRPMIQDTHGNFLDQETQLTPYRRNLLDLLCDSSMIPYPEPYQSSYQRRRLGALNREWQPTTLKLSVGPDISLDRDYQILPLPDLDMVVDPLPEFLDAMDWVPEIEVQSDDNDSEYNVTEDYLSGKEHVSVSSDSSRDLECSTDENDGDTSTLKDGSRRSRRRHMNADAEVMTSSGRRVKRRNFEECSEDIYKNNKSKKNPGRKALKKRSASNTLRPPRAAASKALTLFSKITGASTDVEDGDESEDELSGSESLIQDSDIETYQSEDSLQTKHLKQIKGKEVATNGYTPMLKLDETLESHSNLKNRKKLILRFSRHPKSMVPSVDESTTNTHAEIPGSSTGPHLDRAPSIISEGQLGNSSSASPDGFEDLNTNTEERQKRLIFREMSGGTKDQTFRWGGARARSTKRRRTEEFAVFNRSEWSDFINSRNCGIPYAVKGPDRKNEAVSCVSPKPKSQIYNQISDELVLLKEKHPDINIASHNGKAEYDGCGGSTKDGNVANDSYDNKNSDAVDQFDSRMKSATIPTKLRIRSRSTLANANPIKSPLSETFFDGESERSGPLSILAQQNMNPSAETFHKDATIQHSERCEDNGTWESETQETGNNGSMTQDLFETRPHPGNKVINVFYRRSRSHKAKTNLEDDSGRGMESTSNASSEGNIRTDFHEGTAEGSRRTRSMGRRATGVSSTCRVEHVSEDHQKPNTRMTNGTRSGRSRRASDTFNDATLIERRKPNQSLKKISWLMTCVHDGIRYIPQMGDEVVYLRQGHQQYLTGVRGSRDVGPWQSIKGYVRAVEYCKVVDLNYATFPGSGESCCKLTLEFVDPASGVCGKSFKVTLPEDTGLPDFLVERSRFDAAVQRKWTQRDKCKVWWKNEGDEDGNWWEGRIIRVEPESVDFRDSPWERYTILYKSDPPEISRHSPWELCDHDTQWELPQQPQIEEGYREKLLDAFAELEESGNKAKDQYGIQKLKQASDKSYFRNRFPVPLSLEVIQARLENNYYRSLDALRHDIKIAMSNAESYFERNVEVAPKMRRLSEWFRRTLSYL